MHLNATNAREYLQSQLDDMGFDEMRHLAGFLEENELHLADISQKMHKLEMLNNDANLNWVDADKRADVADERMRRVFDILNGIYG